MTIVTYDQIESIRLDVYMSETKPQLSRSYISKLIDSGHILVNGTIARPGLKLKQGDQIHFDSKELQPPVPKKIVLPIIYEDDFCIVINKPSGIITHAKGINTSEGSVASFIQDRINPELQGNRAGIVHRLDRGTSGVIIVAKTAAALKYLQRQFAKRQTTKTYLAIVEGVMERQRAIINMPIERNPKRPSTFRVGANGKTAETNYEVIASNDVYSLLRLTPKTGRTHQLRVHLKAIGHPIIGDDLYGGKPEKRLMLHASELEVILPDQGRRAFSAPLPTEFTELMPETPKGL